jgi:transposase InsO family protein
MRIQAIISLLLPSGQKPTPFPNKRLRQWWKRRLPTSFSRFGVPRELHSDQGRNFGTRPMQEVLQRLGVSKPRTTPLHLQSDGVTERYIKTVEEHLRKVTTHQRYWDARLSVFLLAYRAFTHGTTGLAPASPVFGRELPTALTCCLGHSPTRNDPQSITR